MYHLLVNNQETGIKIQLADTFLKRFFGWMGYRPASNEGLLLFPCSSIHTFFMPVAIDVLFLNKENRVTKIVENLSPNRIVLPYLAGIKCVLELAAGQTSQKQIKCGDEISWRKEHT